MAELPVFDPDEINVNDLWKKYKNQPYFTYKYNPLTIKHGEISKPTGSDFSPELYGAMPIIGAFLGGDSDGGE